MLVHGNISQSSARQGCSSPADPLRQALRDHYRKNEASVINELLPLAAIDADGRARIRSQAHKLVLAIRKAQLGKGGVDALLNEFALSTEEGIVLMCLAEALLRVPDKLTMDRLIRDKLRSADWASHLGNSESLFVNASAWGLVLTGKVVNLQGEAGAAQQKPLTMLQQTIARLGEPVIRAAVRYAMQVMGAQFVMAETIGAALQRAHKQEAGGYRYSYDMLGEGARTMADANRHMQSYSDAISAIGAAASKNGAVENPGISVKLSAIHPRYEFAQRQRVMTELVPRLKQLALAARDCGIGFTVDAEEAERLDLSLDVIEAVFSDPELDGWEGFGLAIQAYQKRALTLVEWVAQLAQRVGRRMMVRLVKGAYWDSEIKWSQVGGFVDYPVFTRKQATDVCYLACARKLLACRDVIYPQFATHNAYTVAAILELDNTGMDNTGMDNTGMDNTGMDNTGLDVSGADSTKQDSARLESAEAAHRGQGLRRRGYEFQRLHGMGETLYQQLQQQQHPVPCRIYAPVGEHADLLAYLVRRLLENGANSSFVNNVVDEDVPLELLLQDPVETMRGLQSKRNPAIPLPGDVYRNAAAQTSAAGSTSSELAAKQPAGNDLSSNESSSNESSSNESSSNELTSNDLPGNESTSNESSNKASAPVELTKAGFIRAESGRRQNSAGTDLNDLNCLIGMQQSMHDWWSAQQASLANPVAGSDAVLNPANPAEVVGYLNVDDRDLIEQKLSAAAAAFVTWSATPVAARAELLLKLADALETRRDCLIGLCVKEAGKTIADGVAEVREAVDFCRYYADQAQLLLHPDSDARGTGKLVARGVILCISPWNFPLAIFLGQVCAALVSGNTVLAKPAAQTSLVAEKVLQLMRACGFPAGVVEMLPAPGRAVGEQLVPDSRIQGVMLTGSTATAHWLAQALAKRPQTDIPLVAETGGQNAMIVDSTALPEQVVDDVISSGFRSAGQRCSALRVLFLQEDVAADIIAMIKGAMNELSLGDPALLCTDVGPVIDREALASLETHRTYLASLGERAKLLHRCQLPSDCGNGYFFAPHLYEIRDLSLLTREVFGPIVHVIRFKAYELDRVIDQVNATGFGLTLGVHSRIESLYMRIASRARVGNVYVNRNMIGAVVGVQPFGGRGLSGTGPKAGGPNYLARLVKPVALAAEGLASPQATYGQTSQTQASQPQTKRETAALGSEIPEANSLARVELAQLHWAAQPGHERVEVVSRFLLSLQRQSQLADVDELLHAGRQLLQLVDAGLLQPLTLPGPTGESNQLYLESRGLLCVLLQWDGDTDINRGLIQILAALLAGNGVVVLLENGSNARLERCLKWLLEAGLPQHLVVPLPMTVAKVVLSDMRVQGVALAAGGALEKAAQRLLVARGGALIPLICEPTPARLLQRMLVEKTISINTTAAGGNASLMTLENSETPAPEAG